jgi:hypothetical protein
MITITPITAEEQDELLQTKLDERVKLTLATDPSNPDHLKNQIVAQSLCENDWKFAVNNFFWLQDPEAEEAKDKQIPFLLYDYQEQVGDEIVKAIENGYDLPIEKCRALGLTWLALVIAVWGWHFKQWDVLLGSRKAEEVDKRGDPGTLFQKMRFMVERLPKWMFNQELNHNTDKIMSMTHPKHGASIVGEGNNKDFGRSDRRKVAILDEFTSWEQTDRASWQSLSATTKSRIPISTPNLRGTNCYFYQVVQDRKRKNEPVLTLPFWLHPRFGRGLRPAVEGDKAYGYSDVTSPWLEAAIQRAADMQSVAQEILINYEASMGGKVFGAFDAEYQVSDDVEYNPNLPLYINWDFGLDQTALLWIQPDQKNRRYNIIDEYVSDGTTQDGADIMHYIDVVESKPYKDAIHFGDPHSGENRSLAARGESNARILRKSGFIFKSLRTRVVNRVAAGRNILSQVRVSSKCTMTIEMFTSWQMKKTVALPDHSEYSHIGEAYTYFAWNYSNRTGNKDKTVKKTYAPSLSGVM